MRVGGGLGQRVAGERAQMCPRVSFSCLRRCTHARGPVCSQYEHVRMIDFCKHVGTNAYTRVGLCVVNMSMCTRLIFVSTWAPMHTRAWACVQSI